MFQNKLVHKVLIRAVSTEVLNEIWSEACQFHHYEEEWQYRCVLAESSKILYLCLNEQSLDLTYYFSGL